MGVFIHLTISHSVTKEEWSKVYEETLTLVKAFQLAEHRWVDIEGVNTRCLVPIKEGKYGWKAVGDYVSMRTAEDFYLPRDLVRDEKFETDAGDAMLHAYMSCTWNSRGFRNAYDVWNEKTQGEPYHMYLLAIGCLIENRLGD